MDEKDISIAELKQDVASLKHRMNDVEHLTKAVKDLAIEMTRQTEEIKHMNASINGLNQDVADLKARPGRYWDGLMGTLFGALAGVIVTMLFK